MNSNQKGKKGERELAAILKSYGYEDSLIESVKYFV